MNEIRQSDAGVRAEYDIRSYGGTVRPWTVISVPPGHRAHYPTMPLHVQDVANWAVAGAETTGAGS